MVLPRTMLPRASQPSQSSTSIRSTSRELSHTKELAKLTSLTRLALCGTDVSDQSVKDLSQLKKLDSLVLGRTRMTKDGMAVLKKALPGCTIYDQ